MVALVHLFRNNPPLAAAFAAITPRKIIQVAMSVRGIGGRRWQRLSVVSVILCVNFMWFLFLRMTPSDETDPSDLQTKYPLLWNHVHTSRTSGGGTCVYCKTPHSIMLTGFAAFYIPPAWQSSSEEVPETVLDAARLAQRLANVSSDRSIAYSEIPLIIHQTWKNTRIDTWTKATRDMVESWLQYAVETPMAYIMWDDDGVMQFMEEFEPEFVPKFNALTRNVERSDIFRILVPKHIGGIVSSPRSILGSVRSLIIYSIVRRS